MIDIGVAISAAGGEDAFGRLGLLVRDANGSLLGLTSRELMQTGDAVSIASGHAPLRVGTRRAPFHPSTDDAGCAASLAGWFCPVVEIPERLSEWSSARVLDVDELLGRKVNLVCDLVGRVSGIVVRTNWSADVAAGIDEISTYEGLVRVSLAKGSTANARSGISGALLQTDEGELAGIVVGRCDDDLIVVPLTTILKSESLAIATARDIRSHNRTVERDNRGTSAFSA